MMQNMKMDDTPEKPKKGLTIVDENPETEYLIESQEFNWRKCIKSPRPKIDNTSFTLSMDIFVQENSTKS